VPDKSRAVKVEIANIRQQLKSNLTYFSGENRKVLEILQSHIEQHLANIEVYLAKKS
jgi:hypothetical protein